MANLLATFVLAAAIFGVANGLDAAEVTEGPCLPQPEPTPDLNITWFHSDIMWYLPGGSQYQLYRIASGYPDFSSLREFELYYYFCPHQRLDFVTHQVHSYGFGGSTGNYMFEIINPGVIDFTALPPTPGAGERFRAVVTLTDNKNFAFLSKCWTKTNQRGWDVFTTAPNVITADLQKQIEDHATSLGYNREDFEFLLYDSCNDFTGGDGSSGTGHGMGWKK